MLQQRRQSEMIISINAVITIAIVILCCVCYTECWKPIAVPTTSFSLHQSHPALGSSPPAVSSSVISSPSSGSHSRNSIISDLTGSGGSEGSSSSSGSSDRIFSILDDHHHHHHNLGSGEATLFGSGEIPEYQGFKSDGSLFTSTGFGEDACSVDKYAFDHEGTVHYRNKMPKMEQFTICFWMRFTNHSGDHTLFTYSVDDDPREIQIWIANSKGSSYVSMAVHGQSLYRLNYPLKMRTWHHACSSWNGKTGEWQLWVKSERVGRGFHNRLVGHTIPAHGVIFSGGPSITGHTAIGLHFEMTLLQVYKVALTAGKAHRDHKHHHVHKFGHDGRERTTTPPPPPRSPTPQVMNPLLANGQFPSRVRINLANPPPMAQAQTIGPSSIPPGVPSQVVSAILSGLPQQQQSPIQGSITTNFVNGQFHGAGRLLSQQLISANGFPSPRHLQQQSSLSQSSTITFPGGPQSQPAQQFPPPDIQYVDGSDSGSRYLFKRASNNNSSSTNLRRSKTTTTTRTTSTIHKTKNIEKREASIAVGPQIKSQNEIDKKLNKRGLVMLGDGTVIDDTLLAAGYEFEGLAQFGLPTFQANLRNRMNLEDEIKEHDQEPAEDEVKAVASLCTSCDEEPFKGAIALAWKNVVISIDDALKGRSVGGCGYF